LRAEAVRLFDAAIAAVEPASLVARHLVRHPDGGGLVAPDGSLWRWLAPTLVVGAGKAAARMAAGCEQVLGPDNVCGEVVVADGCGVPLQAVHVSEAGHPLPDERGEAAAHRIVERIGAHRQGGILCLVGGGASSLLVYPRAPVTLADKIHTTELLLACGAAIEELNTVRKHLSEVKGGGLLRRTPLAITSLILSDVIGDDPGAIVNRWDDPSVRSLRSDLLADLHDHLPPRRTPRLERGAPV